MNYWKISDFAKKLNKHNNTIDGWFRKLEAERKLHYISRVDDEKVYDELDLKIAEFIVERRDNKWSLNAIFDELPKEFELRPFPEDYESKSKDNQVVDVEKMRATLLNEMKNVFNELSENQAKEQIEEMKKLLPSQEEEKRSRLNTIMVERKISRQLEEEALEQWNDKPAGEKLKKVGWFKKEEDKDKRDTFVKKYIDEYFEENLKKELEL